MIEPRQRPLGIHFTPTHQGQHHYDFIAAVRPGILKVVGSGQVGTPDVQIMADAYAASPESLFVWRNQPLSEQHDALWENPAGTAIRHAATLDSELTLRSEEAKARGLRLPDRDQTFVLGINEPVVELFKRTRSNYADWLPMVQRRSAMLDTYSATLAEELAKRDRRNMALNTSVGQPPNVKDGEFATWDWFPKTRRLLEASKGRHWLGVHEYWDTPGPEERVNWWTYRFMHCDWDCKIATLESGIERRLVQPELADSGWQTTGLSPEDYTAQHGQYIRHALRDPRWQGATPFTLDGAANWKTHYVEGCMPQMVALAQQLAAEQQPQLPEQPWEVRLPIVTGPGAKAPTGLPEQPQPDDFDICFDRIITWLIGDGQGTLGIEGGYNPNDEGSPANYGINQAANPDIDVAALDWHGAAELYRVRYYQASGADQLNWPACLLVTDAAVQHGTGTAQRLWAEADGDLWRFQGLRQQFYARIREDSWQRNGRGWMRRMGLLLEFAANG